MGHAPASAFLHNDDQHDIFLSYSRADTEIMLRVKGDLEAEGFRVWIDQTELEPGTPSWRLAIQRAIDRCGNLLVIFSPTAKQSEWVNAELDYARAQRKRIFGALVKGTHETALPFGYNTLQVVDLTTPATYTVELHKLVVAIAKHLGKQPLSVVRARLAAEEAQRQAQQREADRHHIQSKLQSFHQRLVRAQAEVEAQAELVEDSDLKADYDACQHELSATVAYLEMKRHQTPDDGHTEILQIESRFRQTLNGVERLLEATYRRQPQLEAARRTRQDLDQYEADAHASELWFDAAINENDAQTLTDDTPAHPPPQQQAPRPTAPTQTPPDKAQTEARRRQLEQLIHQLDALLTDISQRKEQVSHLDNTIQRFTLDRNLWRLEDAVRLAVLRLRDKSKTHAIAESDVKNGADTYLELRRRLTILRRQMPEDDSSPAQQHRLSASNPLNWLRVLRWVLWEPKRYDETTHERAAHRMVSTLLWLPLLILLSASSIGTLPHDYPDFDHDTVLIIVLFGAALGGWFITPRMNIDNSARRFAAILIVAGGLTTGAVLGVPTSVVLAMAIIMTAGISGGITAVVMFDTVLVAALTIALVTGMVMGYGAAGSLMAAVAAIIGGSVAAGMVVVIQRTLENALIHDGPTRSGAISLALLILCYSVVIYYAYFGGYKVLP